MFCFTSKNIRIPSIFQQWNKQTFDFKQNSFVNIAYTKLIRAGNFTWQLHHSGQLQINRPAQVWRFSAKCILPYDY